MTDEDEKNNNNNDNNNNYIKKSKMILVDEKDPVGELPPPFPPRSIKVNEEDDMRDFYDIKKEIGRGRFGTVYLVEDKQTRQKFAAKFVNTRRNQDRANVEREVEIMKTLNSEKPHPRLIQLYDAYDMEKEMCLVLEIVDGGELFERVTNDDFVLTERACTVFVRQICEGVEFIHSKNILHLDMKPENILCLSREGNRVKICDFGLARRYDPRKKLQVLFGTPEFVAPEVVNFEPIGFGTDMWSVGVICYVLLSGLSPFMGHNYVETMTNVTHNKYDFEDEAFDSVSDEAKEFIEKLLVLDKSLRPTPAQCLRHPWLRSPPSPQFHPLQRRFPSSASASEDETETEDDTETEDEEEEEEEKKREVVIKVEEKIKEEEETEKYSVRRRRRKEEEEKTRQQKEKEEEEERKKKAEEDAEERKRREMEARRKDLERQIEEKKKRIAEEEERCRRMREEEEAEERRRKEEDELRRRKREEEEAQRKEEEERRKREEEEARKKKEEERRKREEEEAKRKAEDERKKREEVEVKRKKEEERKRREEEEARRNEEEEKRKREEEEETRRKRKEEEIRREQEAGRKKKEEEVRRKTEVEKRRKEEEEKKRKEAEEKRRREAEEKRRKEVEEKKRKEAEKKRQAEEKQAAEQRRKREEEEQKRREAEKVEENKVKEECEGVAWDVELARSKAQLREFVARWNAHPNSPYVVASEAPRGIEAARLASGASLTSMAALPPTDLNPADLDDEDEAATAADDEEFVHYTFSAPMKGPATPPQVARHLETRLKQLQKTEPAKEGKAGGKSGRKGGGKGGGRGEKRRSSSRSPSSRTTQQDEDAEAIIQQILNVDHRSAYEEYQRMVGGVADTAPPQRPEVVALQQEAGVRRRSRQESTGRQPRRLPSRDVPCDERPPSRETEHSPAPVHRRPSRDVPLTSSQKERLAKAAGGGAAPQAWPDLIVAPQDEADEEVRQFSLDVPVASLLKSPSGTLRSVPGLKVSQDPEGNAAPHKGAPSLTPPPSPPTEKYKKPALSPPPSPTPTQSAALPPTPSPTPSSATDSKPALTPPPSPIPSQKDAAAAEDAPSRLVAWILDIGSAPTPPPRQNSATSLQDRVTQWEARDGRPRGSATPSPRLSPSPRRSPSSSPSRLPQECPPRPAEQGGDGALQHRRPQPPFNVLTGENSSTEKVIQTPWGALKRSPSKTSFSKSPSREREASPAGRGKAASEAGQGPAPRTPSAREAAAPRQQDGLAGWAAGGKSHTLPRSAKLLRQKSMCSVPGGGEATQQEAEGSLKRKSKFPPSPNKRPLAPLLFSAQDRISMFEKQQPATRGPPKPLARTRSSVTLGGNVVNDPRADRSQVGFMKTRLLGKAGRGAAPALPEEPATPEPVKQAGPDAA